MILLLHKFGLATGLRKARQEDIADALVHMQAKHHHLPPPKYDVSSGDDQETVRAIYEIWDDERLQEYVEAKKGRCVMVIKGYVVDATGYLGEHVSIHIPNIVRVN